MAQDELEPPEPDAGEILPEEVVTPPQPIPGLEEADFRIRPAAVMPEGTFISRRAGRVVHLPNGERAFVFHPDETGMTLRPMVLLPALVLQRMEQAMEDRDPGFLITGEVFAYLGVNYLLPTHFSLTSVPGTSPGNLSPSRQGPGGSKPAGQEQAVQELIRELEQQRRRPRVSDPALPTGATPPPATTTPSPPPSPVTPAPRSPPLDTAAVGPPGALAPPGATGASALIPEGQILSRRRGRMIRLSAGEWAVAFDSGTRQVTELDRPLVLLPNMNLQRMQGWGGRFGDSVPLEISGRITQYGGRNYLLTTLFRVYPAHTPLEPIQ